MKRAPVVAFCIAAMCTVALSGCAVVDKVTGAYDVVTGIGKDPSWNCPSPTIPLAARGYDFNEKFCGDTWPSRKETIRAVERGRTTVSDGTYTKDERFEVDYVKFTTGGGNGGRHRIEASYVEPGVSLVEKYGDGAASLDFGNKNLMEIVVYARYLGTGFGKNTTVNLGEITYLGTRKARGGLRSTFILELGQKVPFLVGSIWDPVTHNFDNCVYFDTRQI